MAGAGDVGLKQVRRAENGHFNIYNGSERRGRYVGLTPSQPVKIIQCNDAVRQENQKEDSEPESENEK